MNTGIIGLHIEANSPGYSRDNAIQQAQQVGGKYAVVVNDSLLCNALLDMGVTPIYRINRQGFLDDNQQQYGNTREYIRAAHTEVPDKRALLYWNNEPGQHDLERLNAAALEAIDEANQLGRKLVILNWSYGNPEPVAWNILAPAVTAAVAGGHYIGVHEGVDKAHPTVASCYPYLIGRFIQAQKRFGFSTIVTEWAASLDAHHGWQTWMSAQQYASVTEDAIRDVYMPNGVLGVQPFTTYIWNHGFDYFQSDDLKNRFAAINVAYPITSPTPPVEPEQPPVSDISAQEHFCPTNGKLYHMSSGEVMQSWYDAAHVGNHQKNGQREEMWLERVGGVLKLMHGIDTSCQPPPPICDNTVYALYRDPSLTQYGGEWCDEDLVIGKVYKRTVWVQVFNATTSAKIAAGSGWDVTYFRAVAYHPVWTTPEGLQIVNVVECQYSHDPNFTVVNEFYWYARSVGLVGFKSPRMNVFMTRVQPSSRPPVAPLTWWTRPPVNAVEKGSSMVVVPPVPGKPASYTVASAIGLKHRAAPSLSATNLRNLANGQPVTAYPDSAKTADGYTWFYCITAAGDNGWSASNFLVPVLPPQVWTVKLPVPYVSQESTTAARSPNDCRIATYLMQWRYWLMTKGATEPSVPTVDDLTKYTRLVQQPPPSGLLFADVDALAKLTGFDLDYVQPARIETIIDLLDTGKPVSVLVDYSKVNTAHKPIAHEMLVIGYSDTAFLVHDPYVLKANVTVPQAQLETAMKTTPGNSAQYQAMILNAA